MDRRTDRRTDGTAIASTALQHAVKMGEWWRWALLSPDGVVLSRMVGVSSSVNLPLHHKVQRFSSGTGSPGWFWKKGYRNGCGSSVTDTTQLGKLFQHRIRKTKIL